MAKDKNVDVFSGKLERMEIGNPSENVERADFGRGAIIFFGVAIIAAALFLFAPFGSSRTILVQYECPLEIGVAENYDPESFNEGYEKETKKITSNLTHFLETFRTADFDNWGHSYEVIKKGMYHWKSNMFPPEINEGDSIYESACGIGLNLLMTLEILQEVKNIQTLYVYGNEYLRVSAEEANIFFDTVPNKATKGVICTGDSTNLYFVPSNSFDLVYTGYISPLLDPVKFNLTLEANYEKYTTLCEASDWQSMKLSEMAQGLQNDFYGKWVAEMVRIAKPGKAVIVEQISMPYCDEYFDWGGVHPDWWMSAIEKYGWDVDPTSFKTEKDDIFKNRYHMFMRKNNK